MAESSADKIWAGHWVYKKEKDNKTPVTGCDLRGPENYYPLAAARFKQSLAQKETASPQTRQILKISYCFLTAFSIKE